MSLKNIKIQHVVHELDLKEFQPEYAGQTIKVWVNPPMKFRNEMQTVLFEWQQATAKALVLQDPLQFLKETGQKLPEDLSKLKKGSQEKIEEAISISREAKKRYFSYFSKVWEEDSEEDVLALADHLEQNEPGLLIFLRRRTMEMIAEYASARKKA